MSLTERIKQKALSLGFDLVGITSAEPIAGEQIANFRNWLDTGLAGTMGYMHKNFDKRTNPAELLPNGRSVICIGLNYRPDESAAIPEYPADYGRVANFALYQDYHRFMKDGLFKLADFITDRVGKDACRFKVCVDSAPLAERALAQRAGLGFIGKNHMLINSRLGCQILLGEVVTDLKLDIDTPEPDRCSECNKCITACPTKALNPDGRFDAGCCISYLTIEHAGPPPASVAGKIEPWIFGCDECINACPYENNAPCRANRDFKFYPERQYLNLSEIMTWQPAVFEKNFTDSSLQRLGLEGLKANAQNCLASGRKSV